MPFIVVDGEKYKECETLEDATRAVTDMLALGAASDKVRLLKVTEIGHFQGTDTFILTYHDDDGSDSKA